MIAQDLINLLEQKCQQASGKDTTVEIEASVISAIVKVLKEMVDLEKQLEQLQEQMSTKPTVIKKLTEKIKGLEAEIEVLRNNSRVNELEKKVQMLSAELKQSYATKNFTLKNGLLEIEKRYRDYIYTSPDLEELWSEVMALLVEDKDGLQHIPSLRRSKQITEPGDRLLLPSNSRRSSAAIHTITPHPEAYVSDEWPVPVQKQVERLQDSGSCSPVAPADGNPGPAHAFKPKPGLPTTGSARHTRSSSADFRFPSSAHEHGLELPEPGTGYVEGLKPMYERGGPAAFSFNGPDVSPLRPTPLLGPGVPADASAVQHQVDAIQLSIAQLREYFKGFGYFPQPDSTASGGAAAGSSPAAGRSADASYWDRQVEALGSSVEQLMKLYASMWRHDTAQDGSGQQSTTSTSFHGMPDASYFEKQAEDALSSIQHLKHMYAQYQWVPAAAAGDVVDGEQAAAPHRGPPDASSFQRQADELEASIRQLRELFSSSSQQGAEHASSRQSQVLSASRPLLRPPDARGSTGPTGPVQGLQVDQVVALFSSFMSQLAARGMYPRSSELHAEGSAPGAGATTAAGAVDAKQPPSAQELMLMFAQFVQSPGSAVLGAALTSSRPGSQVVSPSLASAGSAAGLAPFGSPAGLPGAAHAAPSGVDAAASSAPGTQGLLAGQTAATTTSPGTFAHPDPAYRQAAATSGGSSTQQQILLDPYQLICQGFRVSELGTWKEGLPAGAAATAVSSPRSSFYNAQNGEVFPDPSARAPESLQQHVLSLRALEVKHAALIESSPQVAELWMDAVTLMRAQQNTAVALSSSGGSLHNPLFSAPTPDAAASQQQLQQQGAGSGKPVLAETTSVSSSATAAADVREGSGSDAAGSGSDNYQQQHGAIGSGHEHPGDVNSHQGVPLQPADASGGGAAAAAAAAGGSTDFVGPPSTSQDNTTRHATSNIPPGAQHATGQHTSTASQQEQLTVVTAASGPGPAAVTISEIQPDEPSSTDAASTAAEAPAAARNVQQAEAAPATAAGELASVVIELRATNQMYAERLSAYKDTITSLVEKAKVSAERTEDLEIRLQQLEKETSNLQQENSSLTRLLVDLKVAYAEKEIETMRLSQRLKRSLNSETKTHDQIEELKRKLLIINPDDIASEADSQEAVRAALQQLLADSEEAQRSDSGSLSVPPASPGSGSNLQGPLANPSAGTSAGMRGGPLTTAAAVSEPRSAIAAAASGAAASAGTPVRSLPQSRAPSSSGRLPVASASSNGLSTPS